MGLALKLHTGFAGGVGQRCDTAVKFVFAPIETELLDAQRLSSTSQGLADDDRRIAVAAVRHTRSEIFIPSAGRTERLARGVVDQLTVNMLVGSGDSQPRAFGGPLEPFADTMPPTLPLPIHCSFVIHRYTPC